MYQKNHPKSHHNCVSERAKDGQPFNTDAFPHPLEADESGPYSTGRSVLSH